MKTPVGLLLFFCFLFFQTKVRFTLCLDESDYWGKDKEQCVRELHLNKDEIQALDLQEIVTENNFKFNRFAHCFFMKSGIQDASGKIKYENIKQLFVGKLSQNFGLLKVEELELLKKVALDAVNWCEENISTRAASPGQMAVRVGNCIMSYLRNANKE